MRTLIRSVPMILSVSLFGCPAEKNEPAKAPVAPAAKPEPKPAAAAPTPPPIADPACMAAWAPEGEKKTVEVAGKKLELTGTKLSEVSTDEDAAIVLGVVADIKEDTPENLANLDAFLKFFKAEKAEAIVVVGDLGDKQSQIEAALDKLATAELPIFAVIGNREGKTDFNAALAAVTARHPFVFNLNQTRLVALDDVALVSIAGYYNKVYIHADDGCEYGPGDLEATKPIVKAAEGKTVVIVSHGPPNQEGPEALDRTLEQANVGDPALAKFIDATGIRFGLFANIHEAGGRATDLTGTKLVSPETEVDTLYLNTGPVDAVAWKMNDGTESRGMATVLRIDGRKASFKVHRVEVPE